MDNSSSHASSEPYQRMTNAQMTNSTPAFKMANSGNHKFSPSMDHSSSYQTANQAEFDTFIQRGTSPPNQSVFDQLRSQLENPFQTSGEQVIQVYGDQNDPTTQTRNETNINFEKASNGISGDKPTKVRCPRCQFEAFTEVSYKMRKNGKCLLLIFLLTLLWPCALFILCTKNFKYVLHECPNCGNIVSKKEFKSKEKLQSNMIAS